MSVITTTATPQGTATTIPDITPPHYSLGTKEVIIIIVVGTVFSVVAYLIFHLCRMHYTRRSRKYDSRPPAIHAAGPGVIVGGGGLIPVVSLPPHMGHPIEMQTRGEGAGHSPGAYSAEGHAEHVELPPAAFVPVTPEGQTARA